MGRPSASERGDDAMAERISDWTRFKLWLKSRKAASRVKKLRQSGELQRILDESAYAYLPAGSFLGDDWYHVYPKGSNRQEDFVYSSLNENDVLLWIVEHHQDGTSEAGR
jgi:hypothetical protein